MSKKQDEPYTPEEIAQRADAALKRALSMPPKPHKPIGKKPKKQAKKPA